MTETYKIAIVGILAYLLLAPLLAAAVCARDKEPSNEISFWVCGLASPATLFWLLLLGCLSIPYFELYPERHLHSIDYEGTDEEKAALAEYRRLSNERRFFRRCLEYCRLCTSTKPALPQIVADYKHKSISEFGNSENFY